MKSLNTILLFIFLIQGIFAQDVQFNCTSPNVVGLTEVFRLTYTVNTQEENFTPPQIKDFDYNGPSKSSSYNTQIINGKTEQTVLFSYIFTLRAKKVGKFTIGPATITVKGKKYKTKPVTIEVVKGQAPAAEATPQNQNNSNEISSKDLFTRINVSKQNVYKGEYLLAVLKVYTALNLAGFNDSKFPSYDGFWSQEIPTPTQITLQRENINGIIYNVGVIRKTLLFPQRNGEIVIEPFELECLIRKQNTSRSIFDNFFGSSESIKKRIISPGVTIIVTDFPIEGRPGSFKNAVGQFTVMSSLDKQEVKANEAITLTITVSGTGNLKLIDPFNIEFPPDFEVYDPKVTNNNRNTEAGQQGNISFEYLIIPRHAGDYKIPASEFSYFNPLSDSYNRTSSRAFDIKVLKGDPGTGDVVISGFSKEDVKYLGSDIRYIRTDDFKLKKKGNSLFGSISFYLAYIVPLLVFILVLIFRRAYIKKRSDTILLRNKQANKISKKRLKKASVYLKENKREEFCSEVLRALWGYLSDKLSIATSELSKDFVEAELHKLEVDEQTTISFMEVINNCEYDKYSPEGQSTTSEEIYKNAIYIISELEKQLK
ncbi:BatD family protein [Bacteroidota bacterium]